MLRTVPVGTRVYVAHFSSLSTECAQVDSPELRSETRLTLPNRAKVTKATDFHAEILENGIFSGFSGCTHLVKISLCTLLKPISVRFRQSKTSSGFAFSKSASIVSSRCPAPLAQLDRASVYGTEGQGFESLRARSIYSQYHADPQPLRLIADQISRAFRFPKHTYWSSRHVGETSVALRNNDLVPHSSRTRIGCDDDYDVCAASPVASSSLNGLRALLSGRRCHPRRKNS